MSTAPAQNKDLKSLETRLGLVMYGGVSLAIYINGAAQEFFRAVRGRGVYKFIKALTDSDITVDIISGTSAGGINGIMLAYALCNGREFSDAAGLWRNDGDIRRLLRSPGGDVESAWSLLDSEGFYQPQLEAAFREMRQLQSSEEEEDVSLFSELDLFVTGTDVDGNRFTQFDDAGHAIDVKDHRAVFHLKHRQGRKEPLNPDFKTSPDQTSKGNRELTYKALAKLSRITSCFPGAFSPVTVTNVADSDEVPDGRLQYWGRLGKESCFLDGGLIDNKPFTYTLREIFFRGAVGKVDRKLFYVEPDPEHWEVLENASQPNFFQAIVASLIGIPGYESINDDLKLLGSHNSKLERYRRVVSFLESQGTIEPPTPQVEKLYKRSRLIALSEWIVHSVLKIQGRYELLDQEARKKAAEMVSKFDKSIFEEQQGADGDAHGATPDRAQADFEDYLQRLFTAVAEGGPGEEARRIALDFQAEVEKTGHPASKWPRADEVLDNFDIRFRLRRVFHTIYFIEKKLGEMKSAVLVNYDDTEEDVAERHARAWEDEGLCEEMKRALKYKRLWHSLNSQMALYDIISSAMENVIDESDFDWKKKKEDEIWGEAQRILKYLLDEKSSAAQVLPTDDAEGVRMTWLTDDYRALFNKELRALAHDVAEVTKQKMNNQLRGIEYDAENRSLKEPPDFKSLLRIFDEQEQRMVEQILPDEGDEVRKVYEGFSALDAKLFPIELVAELNEKDIIKTYRISPHDAKKGFSNKGLSDKVSGDALYHFGGFFKRSWRSNDILWGRLDCLCQLVETLLDPKRIREVLSNAHLRAKVRERFYEPAAEGGGERRLKDSLSPAKLFPHVGQKTHENLERWLCELLKERGDGEEAEKALDELLDGDEFKRRCEDLIEAAQFEVLVEDLPSVISDALQEQVGWNQFRNKKREAEGENGQDKWKKLTAKDDPFVFHPPTADLDPFYGVVAAAGQAADWMEKVKAADTDKAAIKPSETRLGTFFREDYKIGTEALLRDMPLLVVLEIVSVSLLVLRNCVLDIFDKGKADAIRSHPLYLFAVDWPLRGFNVMVRFLRRAPRWEKQIMFGAGGASVLIILLTILGYRSLLYTDKNSTEFSYTYFVLLIVFPALVLFTVGLYLSRESGKKKSKKGTALRLIVQGGHALLLLFPLIVFGFYFNRLAGINRENWIPSDGDGLLLFGAFVLGVLGPYLAYFLVSGLLKDYKLEMSGDKLKSVMVDYFNVDEMQSVARRTVANVPCEWVKVHDILKKSAGEDSAGEDEEKMRRLEHLRKRFGSRKFVKWSGLKSALEESGMNEEMWLLADTFKIPLEDDDWVLERDRVREVLVPAAAGVGSEKITRFDKQFAQRQQLKWGEVSEFLNKQNWQAGRKALRLNFCDAIKAQQGSWPYVEEKETESWEDPRRAALKMVYGKRTWKEWRRQHTAEKITVWARQSHNLPRLATHMRFVNPEALYGE